MFDCRKMLVAGMVLLCAGAVAAPPKKPVVKPKAKAKVTVKAKAPVKKPAAGAVQMKALEGQYPGADFNNGRFQLKFSNLRQALAWNGEGAGSDGRFVLVDYSAGNVQKTETHLGFMVRFANDKGEQVDDDVEVEVGAMLPASRKSGTFAARLPFSFTPTKFILRFGYDGGESLRVALPKGFKWNDFGNRAKLGGTATNDIVSATLNQETDPRLPADWEQGEGIKNVFFSGTVTSLLVESADVIVSDVELTTTDGEAFEVTQFVTGEESRLKPLGVRKIRFGFRIPEDAVPQTVSLNTAYQNGAPIVFTCQ